ncbi:hypothetical protein BX600DRAFT_141102 [Xylariales sp. PMI_506]|nr:hypothetical protein BX600DRAFT_141102 [Xylariales sp. PMI_506]
MFTLPTEEVLHQTIFDPNSVVESSWIVYVNYILLALAADRKAPPLAIQAFRSNVQLALCDSKIFLLPSTPNIQSLMLLATHGEEFATPNMSWMMLGHACHQAQALNLPVSRSEAYEERQRVLCAFWSLFIVEKSCSMAFGRPIFLATSLYRSVPKPDREYLEMRYCPHNPALLPMSHGNNIFAPEFYHCTLEFALLTGSISEASSYPGQIDRLDVLRDSLHEWHTRTQLSLKQAMADELYSGTGIQLHEMEIGIKSMEFQYLHLLIVSASSQAQHSERRITWARKAIKLLPDLVSNSTQVYNGIVWQILYYPFTPFLVLLSHILQSPTTPDIDRDVERLALTVQYFRNMRTQLSGLARIAGQLADTAEALHRLARHQAADRRRGSDDHTIPAAVEARSTNVNNIEDSPTQPPVLAPDALLSWLPESIAVDLRGVAANTRSAVLPSAGPGHLSVSCDDDATAASEAQAWMTMGTMRVGDYEFGITGGNSSRDTKRPFDSMFDWFSWDAYYEHSHALRGGDVKG